ncbi:MAG: glyceraldehyde-3-phosphate dehydrogenase [Acidobacteria bacterium]|nr:glyceraldehyde-3-phosphate dehydrogenase [Acidobacteriota bacterium]
MSDEKLEGYLADWKRREQSAEAMVPLIGRLFRERGVIVKIFGSYLVNRDPIEILKAHRFARQILESEISVHDTLPILQAVSELDLAPARIDLANLTKRFLMRTDGVQARDFVAEELASVATGRGRLPAEPQDVVLYGFGRIGRLLARILIDKTGGGDQLRLRAVVVRPNSHPEDLAKRANLLRRDSVHGPFNGSITLDEEENALIANGNMIRVLYSDAPEKVDYRRYGIDDAVLIDNTGAWRDREGLGRHLQAPGIAKVILTAPGKGDIPNIVCGVNHHGIADAGDILSAASCTTNAIVPLLKVVNDEYGIAHGHVETCHAFTNDQNLTDNYHKKPRRGRSAALNLVITETGAASAVAKAIPELTGKLTGNAIRVPTPNVSLAILNLELSRDTSAEELNRILRQASLEGPLQYQIDYTNSDEVVSTDFVGNRHACIVDAQATIVNGHRCVLYVWYDNEFGYSRQVVRILEEVAGRSLPTLP